MTRYRPLRPATGVVRGVAGVAAVVVFLAAVPIGDDPATAAAVQSAGSVIDRTYSCATALTGGIREIELRAHAGSRGGSEWRKLPYAVIASGGGGRTADVDVPAESSLVWISAGKPSPGTTLDDERLSFNARVGGTIGMNRDHCTPVSTRLPLTWRGLAGGTVGQGSAGFECEAPQRVLVRVRALVDGETALRERGRLFRATNAVARLASFSVATSTGRLLAHADVSNVGKTRLFTARACTRN